MADIEKNIKELALKGRDGKLTVDDLIGGNFTITNGGVFGSLMSTPIINPPQSAILGMHAIKDRPMAVNGKVEILPMMYLALSYDHRLIDGRESVGFLVAIKELLEEPDSSAAGRVAIMARRRSACRANKNIISAVNGDLSPYRLNDNDYLKGWTEHMNLHEYQAKTTVCPLWLTGAGGLCLYYSARSRRSRFKNRCGSVGSEMSGSRWRPR
ncbi:Dihydrolipoyllysine-residue succinyltransferase component of 2-oxoglutarate dehydrogenase complex [Raoultella terrigena]|uniref:Dihydrolipoyllysine-residue succinyltransferase component of 2-oxoglutarate dehydrogenase complex n=1 Tax=Raoultella terrigena TaxID=577 RepID=A0A485B4E5_RAOTE|nr:Dihydrolipoyllysine-residue succinyltransferase component of 2-oxoglutarate dehydrogenase complex [Raoultella terrigena]